MRPLLLFLLLALLLGSCRLTERFTERTSGRTETTRGSTEAVGYEEVTRYAPWPSFPDTVVRWHYDTVGKPYPVPYPVTQIQLQPVEVPKYYPVERIVRYQGERQEQVQETATQETKAKEVEVRTVDWKLYILLGIGAYLLVSHGWMVFGRRR